MKLFREIVLGISLACAVWGLSISGQSLHVVSPNVNEQIGRDAERLNEVIRRIGDIEKKEVPERIAVIETKLNALHTMLWAGLAGICGLLVEAAYRVIKRTAPST